MKKGVVDGHLDDGGAYPLYKVARVSYQLRSVPSQTVLCHDRWADIGPTASLRIAAVAVARVSSTNSGAIATTRTYHEIGLFSRAGAVTGLHTA